jgi:hypothetical protein
MSTQGNEIKWDDPGKPKEHTLTFDPWEGTVKQLEQGVMGFAQRITPLFASTKWHGIVPDTACVVDRTRTVLKTLKERLATAENGEQVTVTSGGIQASVLWKPDGTCNGMLRFSGDES